MARKATNALILDVTKLPVLGKGKVSDPETKKVTIDAPNGIYAQETTVKAPNGKEVAVTHYHFTTQAGMTSYLNACLSGVPEENRGPLAQNVLRIALARYTNSLLDQVVRKENDDPIKPFYGAAEKLLKNKAAKGDEKAKAVLALGADENNAENLKLYNEKIRAVATKIAEME